MNRGAWKVRSADSRRPENDSLLYATGVEARSVEQRQDGADGLRDPDMPGEQEALLKTKWNHDASLAAW